MVKPANEARPSLYNIIVYVDATEELTESVLEADAPNLHQEIGAGTDLLIPGLSGWADHQPGPVANNLACQHPSEEGCHQRMVPNPWVWVFLNSAVLASVFQLQASCSCLSWWRCNQGTSQRPRQILELVYKQKGHYGNWCSKKRHY